MKPDSSTLQKQEFHRHRNRDTRKKVPISKNPFNPEPKGKSTFFPNADSILAGDLLLDVAVTTTIASLTDGTPVLQAKDAISYMCFLGLAWWIWASQVLYNVRFRQKDWWHLIFVILQLFTFCALAAFTGGFDISQGIVPSKEDVQYQQYSRYFIVGGAGTEEARSKFISRINSVGISSALAFSRFTLLIQYFRVLSCAGRTRGQGNNIFFTTAGMHCAALALSLFLYTASIVVVGTDKDNATRGHSAGKIFLWIFPILLEFSVHCCVNVLIHKDPLARGSNIVNANFGEWLNNESVRIIERADTVFVILLGAGLDRITRSFQPIAGNVIVDSTSALLVVSAGIIFVTQLTLYFNLKKYIEGRTDYLRVLLWFFTSFFYLAALILTLQGTAALLELGNLIKALDLPLRVVRTFGDAISNNFQGGSRLATTDPNLISLEPLLTRIGVSYENTVQFFDTWANYFFSPPINGTDKAYPMACMYALTRVIGAVCLQTILKNLDKDPEYASSLDAQITKIVDVDLYNSTDLRSGASNETFGGMIDDARMIYAEPADWFFGVAGTTLLMQFILWWILHPDWLPAQKRTFEFWIQILRFSFGSISVLLLSISVNKNNPPDVFPDAQGEYIFHDTVMHELGQNGWTLGIFALIIGLEQLLEQIVEAHVPRVGPDDDHKENYNEDSPENKKAQEATGLLADDLG